MIRAQSALLLGVLALATTSIAGKDVQYLGLPTILTVSPEVSLSQALTGDRPPAATDGERVPWKDPAAWRAEEHLCLWTPLALLTVAGIGVEFGADPPRNSRWDSRNSFDDSFQDIFAADSASTRNAADDASTGLLIAAGLGAFVETMTPDTRFPVEQKAAVGLTAAVGSWLVNSAVKSAAGRERPYARHCSANAKYSDDCDSGRDDNASFFSGHASMSATAAGLICTWRLHKKTVKWTDRLICGTAVAGSLTTGLLRMSSENHYFSDVLVGWGSGALWGYGVPAIFDNWSGLAKNDDARAGLRPLVAPDRIGVEYELTF